MKLKLAGLLTFSHAAAIAVRGTPEWSAEVIRAQAHSWGVRENNYKGMMCTEDLFVLSPSEALSVDGSILGSESGKSKESEIRLKHDAYCYSSEKYKEAISCQSRNDCGPAGSAERKATESGITEATACEQLKQTKKLNPLSWSVFFVDAKPCKPSM